MGHHRWGNKTDPYARWALGSVFLGGNVACVTIAILAASPLRINGVSVAHPRFIAPPAGRGIFPRKASAAGVAAKSVPACHDGPFLQAFPAIPMTIAIDEKVLAAPDRFFVHQLGKNIGRMFLPTLT